MVNFLFARRVTISAKLKERFIPENIYRFAARVALFDDVSLESIDFEQDQQEGLNENFGDVNEIHLLLMSLILNAPIIEYNHFKGTPATSRLTVHSMEVVTKRAFILYTEDNIAYYALFCKHTHHNYKFPIYINEFFIGDCELNKQLFMETCFVNRVFLIPNEEEVVGEETLLPSIPSTSKQTLVQGSFVSYTSTPSSLLPQQSTSAPMIIIERPSAHSSNDSCEQQVVLGTEELYHLSTGENLIYPYFSDSEESILSVVDVLPLMQGLELGEQVREKEIVPIMVWR